MDLTSLRTALLVLALLCTLAAFIPKIEMPWTIAMVLVILALLLP